MSLQLSKKAPIDNAYQEVKSSRRNFWWQWLHGHKCSEAQDKAGAAAEARAVSPQVQTYNIFNVLAEVSLFQ